MALVTVLLMSAISAPTSAEAVTFDPLGTFGKLPPIRDVSLSPDGKNAVVLRPIGDTYHAASLNLETGASKILMAADPKEFLFNWCGFANNERVVCSIRSYIVPQSRAANITNTLAYLGGRTIATRLLAIDIDGSNQIQLVKQNSSVARGKLKWIARTQDNIVSWLRREPNHILVSLAREDRRYPSVYRLNIKNNRMKEVQSFRKGIYRWGADRSGRIVHGFGRNPAGKSRVIYMGDNDLTNLDFSHLGGETDPYPLAYSADGKSLYLLANAGKDTRSVVEVDSKTATIRKEFPHAEGFDAVGILQQRDSGRVLATRELSDTYSYRWQDAALEKEFREVHAALPGKPDNLVIESVDARLNKVIWRAWGGSAHPAYFLYDREEKSLSKLATAYAEVPVQRLNEQRAVTFKARDGLEIPAYLTLPADRVAKNLPTVILPHGGPYMRDVGNFDYWSQFLASLGYAVLQPNYRGSWGYGEAYLKKGFKQWGLAMQDDLDDGLQWMVEEGYTDANRVCMLGGSYGGFAALVASFRSSDRYKCAVSFAGVADLDALVDRWSLSFGAISAAVRVQRGSLRDKVSPIKQVSNIQIPLLIVHGDVDERVPIGQSRTFVAALKKHGKPHKYIELPNGDHHLSLQSHRLTFLAAVKEFLGEHLAETESAAVTAAD